MREVFHELHLPGFATNVLKIFAPIQSCRMVLLPQDDGSSAIRGKKGLLNLSSP